jgi:uncharacterized protein YdeI (YjbR/CyaY-like superfamily)
MKTPGDLPIIAFETQHDWEGWLEEHHADTPGIWLTMAKKGTAIPSITHAEALESALCYGWIDGQAAAVDTRQWRQKFTPRRPKSMWSRVNCEKAMALIADGRMQPAGLRQVELAKSDGRWDAAYEPPSTISIPDDLQRALDENQAARDFFSTLDSRNRYAILFRIHTAKRLETRAARIATFIDMLSKHEKIHP